MTKTFNPAFAAIVGFLALGIARPALADGTVSGEIRYDGQPVAVTHVYARETRSSPGEDQPPRIIVLMTDRAAPTEVIASKQAYYAAARSGPLRGLVLTFEKPSDNARAAIFAPGGAYDDTTVPGIFEDITLTGTSRVNGMIGGHLKTTKPIEFDLDADSAPSPLTYEIDVRFSAPVVPASRPDAVLTGAAARGSEQAAAALAALKLVRTGTLAEVMAQLAPGHPLREGLDGGQGTALLELARAVLPDPATFLATVQRIEVYGDEAIVSATDVEGRSTVALRRADGTWKLARTPIADD